jgi:tetratricopeptide (TPR) repeat protein
MKAFVFTDESLRAEAGRFVWLAVDTEKEKNAPVVEKHPIDAWPTLLVVDPGPETVALRWVGAATVPQLKRILDDGEAAVRGTAGKGDAEAAFARAERHYAARDFPAAAKAYEEAIAAARPGWPGYFRAVESLLFSFAKQDDCASALRVAQAALPRLRQAPSAITLAATGLDCALRRPETDPARGDAIARFESAAREILADPKVVAAADDRSSLHAALVGARQAAKDEAGARKAAAEWARFLDEEASKATTPEARTVFDSHRLSAYIEMGEPQRAIPMLERSERDFPGDYNPPARLAVAYKEMKRWDEALAATDRALARAYGPRTLRMLSTRADVQLAKGDAAAARATLEKALATAEGMPPGQRSERTISAIEKRIAGLPAPPSTPR